MPNRVVVFTNEPVLAAGCCSILSAVPGLELIHESREDELFAVLKSRTVDVLLLQFAPEVTLSLIQRLKIEAPECPIVLWINEIPLEFAFQVLQLGVKGFLLRTAPTEDLVLCLQAVSRGEPWFDKELAERLLTAKAVKLSRRESEIVALVVRGLKNRDIACTLSLSEGTVKVYMSRLFRKVGVSDRLELAVHGLRNTQNTGVNETSIPESLSVRERQLLRIMPEGLRNKEIAARLSITEGTVKVYLSRLFKKMGVRGRYELALNTMAGSASRPAAEMLTGKASLEPGVLPSPLFVVGNGPSFSYANFRANTDAAAPMALADLT